MYIAHTNLCNSYIHTQNTKRCKPAHRRKRLPNILPHTHQPVNIHRHELLTRKHWCHQTECVLMSHKVLALWGFRPRRHRTTCMYKIKVDMDICVYNTGVIRCEGRTNHARFVVPNPGATGPKNTCTIRVYTLMFVYTTLA